MAVVYIAVSFVASLAMSLSVYQAFGSLMLGMMAYALTGILVLGSVLWAAALRDSAERAKYQVYPAE